jgi:hypothetical protein
MSRTGALRLIILFRALLSNQDKAAQIWESYCAYAILPYDSTCGARKSPSFALSFPALCADDALGERTACAKHRI